MAYRLYNSEEPESSRQSEESGSGLRNAIRTGARIGSVYAGLPGSLAQGGLAIGNLASKALTGHEYLPDKFDIAPPIEDIYKTFGNMAKEVGHEGYLEPRNEQEHRSDELIQDIASFLHPMQGPYTKFNVGKRLASVGVGHGLKYITEQFPEFKKYGDVVKLGGMLATSLGMGSGLREEASNLRKSALQAVPSGTFVKVEPLMEKMNHLKGILKGDVKLPYKKFVMDRANDIINTIESAKGQLTPDKIVKLIDEMNAWFKDPSFPYAAKNYMGSMINDLYDVLNKAPNLSKEVATNFKQSQNIFKVMQTSSMANEAIQKVAGKIKNKLTHPLALIWSGSPVKMAAGAGALHGVQGASKFVDNFVRSPAARKAYAKLATSALKGQSGAIAKNLINFNNVMTKEAPVNTEKRYKIYNPE